MLSTCPVPLLDAAPDILVIGGGLAALMAALAAHEQGCSAAIASLGPVGRSGNTAVTENAIAGITNAPDNTIEAFVADLERSGKGIDDPALTANLAGHSREIMNLLKQYGVSLPYENGDFVTIPRIGGHSVARIVRADTSKQGHAIKGRAYLTPLAERAMAAGIPFLNGLRAIRLLQKNDRVCGVMFHERRTGKIHIQPARRVILATGGYAGLYKNTTNVSDMYGDGIGLALLAGCPVRDMEMVQYLPTMLVGGVRMNITNQVQAFGSRMRNSTGEAFMARYDPAAELAARDSMARAIFTEIQSGRGVDGAVYVDCTDIDEKVFNGPLASFASRLIGCGLDPRKQMLRGAPGSHYTMGGVVIDSEGRTPVPGLYAAGEVAGGVHGANRLGGAALMEATVFGRLAALAACSDDAPEAKPDIPALPAIPTEEERTVVEQELKKLRAILWEHASIVRDEVGLTTALNKIETMRSTWSSVPHAPGNFFATTLLLAETIAQSALMRTESRGAHYRSDYPETDPAWAVSIACSLRDGKLGLSRLPKA